MGIYRNIHSGFWNDDKLEEMTRDERYLFFYLITNLHTNLCGCYKLTIKQLCQEADFSKNLATSLLEKLTNVGLIKYDFTTREVLIRNWAKYNWTTSPKLVKPLLREITDIESQTLKNDMVCICKRYGIDTSLYGMDTVLIGYAYPPVTDTVTVSNINNLNNKPFAPEPARAGNSLVDSKAFFNGVKDLCSRHLETIYERHQKKPTGDLELGRILSEVERRYTLAEIEDIFKHAAQTYIIKPKMQNLDLIWVCNNLESVKGLPIETLSSGTSPPPRVDFRNRDEALKRQLEKNYDD